MRIMIDFELVRQIATSDAFSACYMAERCHEFGIRLGADFLPAIATLEQPPTCRDGGARRAARKALAQAQRGALDKRASKLFGAAPGGW